MPRFQLVGGLYDGAVLEMSMRAAPELVLLVGDRECFRYLVGGEKCDRYEHITTSHRRDFDEWCRYTNIPDASQEIAWRAWQGALGVDRSKSIGDSSS